MGKPQEVIVHKDTEENKDQQDFVSNLMREYQFKHREGAMQVNLASVSAQLTEICVVHEKKPEEVVDTYSKVYDLVQDWYAGKPIKDQIKAMLDSLLPTETLATRGYMKE